MIKKEMKYYESPALQVFEVKLHRAIAASFGADAEDAGDDGGFSDGGFGGEAGGDGGNL